jgi:hypothetical protein
MRDKIVFFTQHPEEYQRTCHICQDYIQSNLGSCDRIFNIIQKHIV